MDLSKIYSKDFQNQFKNKTTFKKPVGNDITPISYMSTSQPITKKF